MITSSQDKKPVGGKPIHAYKTYGTLAHVSLKSVKINRFKLNIKFNDTKKALKNSEKRKRTSVSLPIHENNRKVSSDRK